MGRKNKYETHIKPHLSEIPHLYDQFTESQIAKKFGVSVASFENYKLKYPELKQALQNGREVLIEELKNTLKQKAKGFHYKETKKTIKNVDGVKTQVIEEFDRYSPPDTGAIHLLLKNIDDNWRNDDKTTIELKREKLEIEKRKADEESW